MRLAAARHRDQHVPDPRAALAREMPRHRLARSEVNDEWRCLCTGWAMSGIEVDQARAEHLNHWTEEVYAALAGAGYEQSMTTREIGVIPPSISNDREVQEDVW